MPRKNVESAKIEDPSAHLSELVWLFAVCIRSFDLGGHRDIRSGELAFSVDMHGSSFGAGAFTYQIETNY